MNSNPPIKLKLPVKCWKSLYMKLTSVKVRYLDADIERELLDREEYFKEGIHQFSVSVPSSHIELRENKTSTFMESFYQRLSKILYLDQESCKQIFANYLLYNCNNSGILLQERLEKNIRAVLLSTWSFYAQERIFFLKCYFHVMSLSMDVNAPYSEVFKKFLSKMTVRERHSSLLKQYKSLIHKELPSASNYGLLTEKLVPLWIDYNLREQLEVLDLLILVTSRIEITLADVEHLVELIQTTSFGRYQCFFYHHSHLTESQHLLQQHIHYAITLYAIQILNSGWKKDIYRENKSKFNAHNKILYPTSYDASQGPIVIAWMLVLYHRLTNINAYDEQLSEDNFILLNDDLWKVLDDTFHSNIMDIPAICNVVEPVIDEMVFEMFSKFGINAFYSQMTLASMVSFFCKLHTFPFNRSTAVVLQYFKQRFPLDCHCLFKILSAILNWTSDIGHRKEVLEFLSHLKYTVLRDECKLKTVELNKYVLEYDLIPLKNIPNVHIPRGVAVLPDFEENIVTMQRSLPLWDVMRNYVLMYQNENTNDQLINTVIEIINFVEISLQKVKTIDDDILRFSELVVHVMWKSSSNCNSSEKLKLLACCINLHNVLFCIMPEDIIKCFEIYNFLPGYPVRMKRKDVQVHDMYYTQSRIYTIVCCKEAKTGEYPVLFSYLNFFHNVVQNILESWYTIAGLKFIFHVYNNVNNDFWKFKKRDDRNLIIWHCIEVLHEILNHGLKDLYDKKDLDSLVDFKETENEYVVPTTYFITKFCVQSIMNSVNEGTVLSTAITGDAILLETVVQSACWNKGKSAIFINTITYSLSLIQRCLIYIDLEKKLKKTEIVFDHLFQPDKCLALLSYRYNCFSDTISLLAIKLLIKLASIKENCMFSWLQYSNELLQKEFLYPLYSNNESNAVKSSLLALMGICITQQIVIADALLEIDKVRRICLEKSRPDCKWQNLLVFTSNYINDIERKADRYLSNMHCAVLYVIYACWEKKLKVPQQYYKMSDEFWKDVLLPLHGEPCDKFSGYRFILEILCLEIIGSRSLDDGLKKELKTLLNSEHLIKWTEYCANVIDETTKLTVEFESIPIAASAMAESWKKFMKVATANCTDLIQTPAKTTFPVYRTLVAELADSEFRKKAKFLCDIYRIYLATWKRDCSETNWLEELSLTSQMFVVLNEYYQECSAPYFYSALLEIGYKTYEFGKKHTKTLEEIKDKPVFLLACSGILIRKLKDFSKLVLERKCISMEYPPLLLHLCVFADVIESLDVSDELMKFVICETDFVNSVLGTTNTILKLSCSTRTAKMLLQFQNFIFEKYPLLKVNFLNNDAVLAIFQTVFPGEVSLEQLNSLDTFNNVDKHDCYIFGLNFITNLTKDVSNGSKTLLMDFNSRNKFYLFTALQLITVNLRKEDLRLVIAVITFYKRIAEHMYYCKYDDVVELTQPMFLLFGCVKTAVALLIRPTKLCSLLFGVQPHHLQQFFDGADENSDILSFVEKSYKSFMYIVKIGVETLSTFCLDTQTILEGQWPSEDWNFRWLNKIVDRRRCVLPLLFLDQGNVQEDFTTLATYITLQHRAVTHRSPIEQQITFETLVSNRITLIKYDQSGETLCELSTFLFAQCAMYLLHPEMDQSKKLFFVNQIFVNLKEFIRSALHNKIEEISIPFAVGDYDPFEYQFTKNTETNSSTEMSSGDAGKTVPTNTNFSSRASTPKATSSTVTAELARSRRSAVTQLYENDDEKTRALLLQIVAKLFYKLITTFKHS